MEIRDCLREKILVLDGAMGTTLQNMNLTAADYGGEDYLGCHEALNIYAPHVIEEIHYQYLKAGADIIQTNTFGGTPLVLGEYDLSHKCAEINREAALACQRARQRFWSTLAGGGDAKSHPRYIAGSMGPTTRAISVTGQITFGELIEHFYQQALSLIEGGVDYLLLETSQDTRNIKAGLLGIEKAFQELSQTLPVAVSGTIEPMGTMLAGQGVEALYTSLAHRDLLYLGLNCATGPAFMTDHVRTLSDMAHFSVACVPNAGLPDENGKYLETPSMVCTVIERFMKSGWLNVVGGCCGTTYQHISALKELASLYPPRRPSSEKRSTLSGIDYLEITEDKRPILVGERTNVIGSRKFKKLIEAADFDMASEIGRKQVKNGAHIIDICLANPDRNELSDMEQFLELAIKKIRVPIMVDSTDEVVIERALTYIQGKAIINSVNLEDGEERFEKVCPLAKSFGAALVVGTIDEDPTQGMAITRERKLAVARRSYQLLTEKYGIEPEDIYWDPLVFPCASGDKNYLGSARETIEGIALLKEHFPRTKTVLGISNISFGLPNAGREVLNSIFMYLCTQKGLDLAIVNTELLKRFASISEEEQRLGIDLLMTQTDEAVFAFTQFYRNQEKNSSGSKEREGDVQAQKTLEERLAHYVVEGSKDGLTQDLNLALEKYRPLEIINGPLMEGMSTVGKLFNENKLIVAEVLQSAEVMKASVSHLEPFMEKSEDVASSSKGKMVLATVKGDVHDIGKNLVDIILSNNGYQIINLGIKIASDQLIAAILEHQPQYIGLSGLLVKSAQQMVLTAQDLKARGIKIPLLVGGAALSKKFTYKRIAPEYDAPVIYAKDAMEGLSIVNDLRDDKKRIELLAKIEAEKEEMKDGVSSEVRVEAGTVRSSEVAILDKSRIPVPSDFERHIFKSVPASMLWDYINPLMLYTKHLGIKGKWVKAYQQGDHEAIAQEEGGKRILEIFAEVERIKKEMPADFWNTGAVFQFYQAHSQGNSIFLYDSSKVGEGRCLANFAFQRQKREGGLCLSDYIRPADEAKIEAATDNLCLFITTVGRQVNEYALKLKDRGEYLKSHILLSLGIELAEAYAEYLHEKIRSYWGFPDPLGITMEDRFKARYQGKRYSFGYPACPNMAHQKLLFKLLRPEEDLGVTLTEGFMMEPESSVSAIVFHHSEAKYFSVGLET